MPSDPAEVSCAPVNIILMVVKHILERSGSIHQVTSLCVQNAFRFTSRAAGICTNNALFTTEDTTNVRCGIVAHDCSPTMNQILEFNKAVFRICIKNRFSHTSPTVMIYIHVMCQGLIKV